ncbi:MAG: hypothetical protein ACOZHQ_13680 [Thermodesulfobacteriota bacterium]
MINHHESLTWKEGYYNLWEVNGLDYAKLKLFILSTLWLMSVCSARQFEQINLGKHEENVRSMLINDCPGAPKHYGIIMQKLKDEFGKEMIIVETNMVKMAGHNAYRMVFGGYVWSVLVTSHSLDDITQSLLLTETGRAIVHLVSARDVGFLMSAAGRFPLDDALTEFSPSQKL